MERVKSGDNVIHRLRGLQKKISQRFSRLGSHTATGRDVLSLVVVVILWDGAAVAHGQQSSNQSEVLEAKRLYDASNWEAAQAKAWPLAQQGMADAQFLIGNLYAEGRIGPADFTSARKWWERAALSGHSQAQLKYGGSYLIGKGIELNPRLAKEWFVEAAQGGDEIAMLGLGRSLLSKEGPLQQHPVEGYFWLRVAGGYPHRQPLAVLSHSLTFSGIELGSPEFSRMQTASLQRTLPYANLKGDHVLGAFDRDEGLAYLITRLAVSIAGLQGRVVADSNSTDMKHQESLWSLALKYVSRPFGVSARDLRTDSDVPWVFYRKGHRPEGPEAVVVDPVVLWELVRPGDLVEVADKNRSHLAFVHGVDRVANRIEFMTRSPRTSMLLAGRNALGIRGSLSPFGKTRQLVSISRDEFIQVSQGVLTLSTPRLLERLSLQFPALHADVTAHVAAAGMLVHHANERIACLATGSLWAVIASTDLRANETAREAATDRLVLGIHRCQKSGISEIQYTGQSGTLTTIGIKELAQRVYSQLRPTLVSLDANSIITLASRGLPYRNATDEMMLLTGTRACARKRETARGESLPASEVRR